MKRIIASCFIILIISMTFIIGYTKSDSLVYADSTTDQWLQVTTNEQLAEAFRYYCKSRDLTIEGSIADGVTSFTTKTFNGLCNTLGIDITALQAQIKYQTDGNLGLKFLFTTSGIDAYNRIFAQFLQDNDLNVGDDVDDKIIYTGKWWQDSDGNGCFLGSSDGTSNSSTGTIISYGTSYLYSYEEIQSTIVNQSGLSGYTTHIFGKTYIFSPRYTNSTYNNVIDYRCYIDTTKDGSNSKQNLMGDKHSDNRVDETDSNNCVFGVVQNNGGYFFLCRYWENNTGRTVVYLLDGTNSRPTIQNTNIYITTNNNTINNNTYEGDTVINNEGDVTNNNNNNNNNTTINYNPYPDGGGGGSGGDQSTPSTNTGGGSGEDDSVITFPDFDFHLPEIDWSLGDLSEKFPFSIPFDLIAFFTVLNAEPQAPAINADIPLGSWYTWHFEADFAQFDNWAVIIRNVEFIAFCVGLIYLTIRLVKG